MNDMAGANEKHGVVYTETVIYSPPGQYAADAPYQIAIIDLDGGGRSTVRILPDSFGDRAVIGDPVIFVEQRNGVAYYRKAHNVGDASSE
jgi:uncharacterized OB-fold protein